jgi:hypothetical protein
MSFQTSAIVLAWAAILLLAFGFAGLLRQVQVMVRRPQAMASPTRSPADLVGFTLPADGALAGLHHEGAARTLVVFVSPGCGSCAAALQQVAALPGATTSVSVVSTGGCESTQRLLGDRAGAVRCLADGRPVMDALGVPATPYLLALGPGGVIRGATLVDESTDVVGWLGGDRTESR